MAKTLAPWWETMSLRDEVVDAAGRVEDVQMSLFNAVHGVAGKKVPYADPGYFGDITFASKGLVEFMAQIAVRLGSPDAFKLAKAVWRLDQGMGGGKSHGLVALWHLAEHATALAETDLGRQVMGQATKIAGKGHVPADLADPLCVVLSCDNMVPGVADKSLDGPAGTLGERFLWRLFEGDHKRWDAYRDKLDKNKIAEAITSVGRPVLILVDEVMDWVQKATDPDRDYSHIGDMSFLRDLLDTVNDVPNCAMVVVMIASDKDNITLSEAGVKAQADLEDLLTRNGTRQAVSSGGDFADIIRRRLFDAPPPDDVIDEAAKAFTAAMGGPWRKDVFDKVGWPAGNGFKKAVARSYPFHPALIHLAEQEWSQNAGFQKVRSTIQIFAAAVFTHASRAERGDWAPDLIGPGDLPLSSDDAREALLGSGIVADPRVVSSFREIAAVEVVNPDDARGTARLLDLNRGDTGWNDLNPRAAERAATALFVYSLAPREQGRRGATEPELKAATFVLSNAYGAGDAEVVLAELRSPDNGLAALEELAGRGGQLPRLLLSTRQTLNMFIRAQRNSVTDQERDDELWDTVWGLASTGPFAKKIPVEAPHDTDDTPDLRGLLDGAGIDDARVNRLVVLDPRHFSLLNGIDAETRDALRSAMGLGDHRLAVGWASSAVFVCVNTQRRGNARKLAVEHLARKRVAEIDAVRADDDLHEKAKEEVKESRRQLDKAVKAAYQHIVYLGEDADGNRVERSIRLDKDGHTALDGSTVWAALQDADKAFGVGQFDAKALLHNLRDTDWGKPLSEIRDGFWNTPRLPLLPHGDTDLASALYAAVQAGDARLVDKDGNERAASTAADINVASPGIRLERPAVTPGTDVEVPNLVGMDRPAARLAAEKAGLVLDGPGDGTVKTQTPSAGEHAPAGTTIAVTVAKKPPPPTVEHQVTLTATASVNDTNRDALRQLVTDIATALDDGDVSHIQMTLKVTVPPAAKTKIVGDADRADVRSNVIDL